MPRINNPSINRFLSNFNQKEWYIVYDNLCLIGLHYLMNKYNNKTNWTLEEIKAEFLLIKNHNNQSNGTTSKLKEEEKNININFYPNIDTENSEFDKKLLLNNLSDKLNNDKIVKEINNSLFNGQVNLKNLLKQNYLFSHGRNTTNNQSLNQMRYKTDLDNDQTNSELLNQINPNLTHQILNESQILLNKNSFNEKQRNKSEQSKNNVILSQQEISMKNKNERLYHHENIKPKFGNNFRTKTIYQENKNLNSNANIEPYNYFNPKFAQNFKNLTLSNNSKINKNLNERIKSSNINQIHSEFDKNIEETNVFPFPYSPNELIGNSIIQNVQKTSNENTLMDFSPYLNESSLLPQKPYVNKDSFPQKTRNLSYDSSENNTIRNFYSTPMINNLVENSVNFENLAKANKNKIKQIQKKYNKIKRFANKITKDRIYGGTSFDYLKDTNKKYSNNNNIYMNHPLTSIYKKFNEIQSKIYPLNSANGKKTSSRIPIY